MSKKALLRSAALFLIVLVLTMPVSFAWSISLESAGNPAIVSGKNSVEDISATIQWFTNGANTTSKVRYGKTHALGLQVVDNAFVERHLLELTGLDPNTVYYYDITSVDANGTSKTVNGSSSTYYSFKRRNELNSKRIHHSKKR